jgi:hypothetical protein
VSNVFLYIFKVCRPKLTGFIFAVILGLIILFLRRRNTHTRGIVLVASIAALLVLVHCLGVIGASHDRLRSHGGRENSDQGCLREPHLACGTERRKCEVIECSVEREMKGE